MTTDIINVPTLILYQKKLENEQSIYPPVIISFYRGSISFRQEGNEISIKEEFFVEFLAAMNNNHNEAKKLLSF